MLAQTVTNTSEGQVRQAVCLFLMRCFIKAKVSKVKETYHETYRENFYRETYGANIS